MTAVKKNYGEKVLIQVLFKEKVNKSKLIIFVTRIHGVFLV